MLGRQRGLMTGSHDGFVLGDVVGHHSKDCHLGLIDNRDTDDVAEDTIVRDSKGSSLNLLR